MIPGEHVPAEELTELTPTQVSRALAGEEPVLTELVDQLTPVIQARIARGLLRREAAAGGRSIRQEVEDLTQEVFLELFADDGRVLRDWQPERGLSLRNFVGLVAERRTASLLRSARRSPWTEEPTAPAELDGTAPESDPEDVAASREQLRLLLRRLRQELSPLGWHLFELLFVREQSVAEVVDATGMSGDAVYAWRSRLRRLAGRLARQPCQKPSPGGEYPK
ncbi:MAG: sigma-70 family RNA polymerase sigma factor [bacterium]|nr:sigma-70 family RNA polymerase sigma factor [bacterium]